VFYPETEPNFFGFFKKVMLIALFGIVEKETGFFPKKIDEKK